MTSRYREQGHLATQVPADVFSENEAVEFLLERTGKDLNWLGSVLQDLGHFGLAKANFERADQIDMAAYEADHPATATHLNNLGLVLAQLGDLESAVANYERALRIFESVLGPDHPNTKTVRAVLRNIQERR